MIVECDFFAEPREGWLALWACLNPATQSGYRLRALRGAEDWTLYLEKATAGEYVTLASEGGIALSEGFVALKLEVGSGKLRAVLKGKTRLHATDGAYTEGRVGIEGTVEAVFGEVDFKVNGELLDDYKRTENPLANEEKWFPLAWAEDSGRCYSAEFGWVPASEHSGAYWTPAEYEAGELGPEEEGEGVSVGTGVGSGMVARPLD